MSMTHEEWILAKHATRMTPEQRAERVLDTLLEEGHLDDLAVVDFLALKAAIAAALKPSEAVNELLRAADELRTIMHLDGTTKTPRYDKAAAAVRKELGL